MHSLEEREQRLALLLERLNDPISNPKIDLLERLRLNCPSLGEQDELLWEEAELVEHDPVVAQIADELLLDKGRRKDVLLWSSGEVRKIVRGRRLLVQTGEEVDLVCGRARTGRARQRAERG